MANTSSHQIPPPSTSTTTTISGEETWSALPSDIISSIAERLFLADIYSLKSVCSQWRAVAKSYTESATFFPDQFTDGLRLSSSDGWLLYLDTMFDFHLFQPFCRALAPPLPPLEKLPGIVSVERFDNGTKIRFLDSCYEENEWCVRKVKELEGEFVAKVAFCIIGDGKWREVPTLGFTDIARCKIGFYALRYGMDWCHVEVWDCLGDFPRMTNRIETSIPIADIIYPFADINSRYLDRTCIVESPARGLLLFKRYFGEPEEEDDKRKDLS